MYSYSETAVRYWPIQLANIGLERSAAVSRASFISDATGPAHRWQLIDEIVFNPDCPSQSRELGMLLVMRMDWFWDIVSQS